MGRNLFLMSSLMTFHRDYLDQRYSGCGKSTLLKLIAGYLRPKRGRVELPLPWKKPTKKFQREGLGFVFQQLNLLPLANLSSNLNLVASLAGMSGKETRKEEISFSAAWVCPS